MNRIEIVDHDPRWRPEFEALAGEIRAMVGAGAERIDHIGSTSVPGLAAKDVIDIQVTVADLRAADGWPDEFAGFIRLADNDRDHPPPLGPDHPEEWAKRYWSRREPHRRAHLHVRQRGRANHRYALLFRDYLRAHPASARAYEQVKRALARLHPFDIDAYLDVKDPACDLIMEAAEAWAAVGHWEVGPSDG